MEEQQSPWASHEWSLTPKVAKPIGLHWKPQNWHNFYYSHHETQAHEECNEEVTQEGTDSDGN